MKTIQWFPGHMTKAMRDMEAKRDLCDGIICVLDARTPVATINKNFKKIFGEKPVLYVLNKADLADANKTDGFIKWLEERIDYYSSLTRPIEKFILPGGHEAAAVTQYTRTVTRRAEREIVSLLREEEISKNAFIFINRLSDYFFIVGRYINEVMKVEEPLYDRGGIVFHLDD